MLRPATTTDETVLESLFRSARPMFEFLDPATVADLVRWQRRAQRASWDTSWPGHREFVIEDGGEPIGSVTLHDDLRTRHILDICVRADRGGQGIGTDVLQHLCDDADTDVTLWVAAGNPARSLYERLGFVPVEHTATDVLMRRRVPEPAR